MFLLPQRSFATVQEDEEGVFSTVRGSLLRDPG